MDDWQTLNETINSLPRKDLRNNFVYFELFRKFAMSELSADIFDAFNASATTENRQIFQEDVRAVKSASCMLRTIVSCVDTILHMPHA